MQRAAVVLLASLVSGGLGALHSWPFGLFLAGGVGVLAVTVYDSIEEVRREDTSF